MPSEEDKMKAVENTCEGWLFVLKEGGGGLHQNDIT